MSKGLEALKRLRTYSDSTIDADLEIIENELKVLEIIKKYVDIRDEEGDLFKYSIVDKQYISSGSNLIMSDEEYELLKEVVK